jgi:hypothetical protein
MFILRNTYNKLTQTSCVKKRTNFGIEMGGKIENNEMGGACGAHGGVERCAQGYGGEI